MADSEIKVKVVADLSDIKAAVQETARETGKLKEVAGINVDNIVGKLFVMKQGFDAVTATVGAVASTIKAVTVDLAIMGEQARQVENGFTNLADQAGLAGDKLKDSIVEASAGTIESTRLLQRSSELVVAFGKGAERIPELINLSRQAANAFGKDTEQVFNAISESVRSGNTRGLKQLGILVDTEKAVRDFAAANGVSANALNETGRAQAILNAALEQGKRKFGDAKLQADSTRDSWNRFTNTAMDAAEALAGNFNDTFGGTIRSVLGQFAKDFTRLADQLTGKVNVAADESASKIRILSERLEFLNKQAERFTDQTSATPVLIRDEEIAKVEKAIQREEELLSQQAKAESLKAAARSGTVAGVNKEEITDNTKSLENERKFSAELQAIRMQNAEATIKGASDVASLEEAQLVRRVEMENQLAIKKEEVNANDIMTQQQKNEMLFELEVQHKMRLQELENQAEAEKMAALQRQLEATTNVAEQAAISAEIGGMRAAEAWRKSGGLGGQAVTAFGNNAVRAFDAFGRGAMTASEALKSAFFGMIGDVATAQGKTMVLASIWPPNPAALAAGLGLVALGGLLSSMGGKGSSLGGAGGASGGGGMPEGGMGLGGPSVGDSLNQRRKEVTINVEGNYFDSEQTRMAIVEAVRGASDANDFTVQRGTRR
jgi:hypothetical protein